MATEVRVFGPPGTGKTTTLASMLLEESGRVGPDYVLVLSFTRAGAIEIASRFHERPEDVPDLAKRCGTVHSQGYRLLGSPPIAEKEFAEEWNALNKDPFDQLPKEADLDPDDPGSEIAYDLQRHNRHLRSKLLRARLVPEDLWPQDIARHRHRWEEFKAERGAVDFADMVEIPLRSGLLPDPPPRVLFVDEAQDLSPLELALVRSWSQNAETLVLGGDDDQCIYGFKGSEARSFLSPPIPDSQKVFLRESHRLPRRVHALAERWVHRLREREEKHYQPRGEDGLVRWADLDRDGIALDIEHQVSRGRSTMVIAPCSKTVALVVQALRRRAVPFHNPYRRKRGDWNPLGARRGATTASDRVAAFFGRLSERETWGELWSWVEVLDRKKAGLPLGLKERLKLAAKEAPRVRADLQKEDHEALSRVTLERFEHSLTKEGERLRYAFAVARRRGVEVLKKKPLCTVGTIHSVKGGEAEVVYVIPDLSWPFAEEYERDPDPLRRLFYVAMTRAREELVLLSPLGSRWAVEV